MPVLASIRRMPDATAVSCVIRNKPSAPVAGECVPPHNSLDSPNPIIRTRSPYFSPKSIMAPRFLASSKGRSRSSTNA